VLPDDLGRSARLELGRWYALSCARSEGRVTLTVADPISNLPGASWSEPDRDLGALDADGPVTIGATPTDGGTAQVVAQFRGDLDEVMFRAG